MVQHDGLQHSLLKILSMETSKNNYRSNVVSLSVISYGVHNFLHVFLLTSNNMFSVEVS